MSFGLTNAPAIFKKSMNEIFLHYSGYLLCYLPRQNSNLLQEQKGSYPAYLNHHETIGRQYSLKKIRDV